MKIVYSLLFTCQHARLFYDHSHITMKSVCKVGLICFLVCNGFVFLFGAFVIVALVHFYALPDFDSAVALHVGSLLLLGSFLLATFAIPLSKPFPLSLFHGMNGHSPAWLLVKSGLLFIWVFHFLIEWLGVFWLSGTIDSMFMPNAPVAILIALSLAWILGNIWQFRALRKDPLVLWLRPKESEN